MSEQTTLDVADGGPDRTRWAEYEADFTPPGVVRQFMRHLYHDHQIAPTRILDPCAGAGVFGMVAKEVFPWLDSDGNIYAIEPRVEEQENLTHNNSVVYTQTLQKVIALVPLGEFDLIITNPPFSMFPDVVRLCRPLLVNKPKAMLCLFGLSQYGQADGTGAALFDQHPPALKPCIRGRVKCRTGINPKTEKPYTADAREYAWWCWSASGTTPMTVGGQSAYFGYNLPALSADDRKWTIRPGTEWQQ